MKSENEFLEMKYSANRKLETLAYGFYKGYEFRILNLGPHPTAYVNIPANHPCFGKSYNEIYDYGIDIDVHGGLTYSNQKLRTESDYLVGWWIGWDYAHYDDYSGFEETLPNKLQTHGKKWTTLEIFEDVKCAINKLIRVQND